MNFEMSARLKGLGGDGHRQDRKIGSAIELAIERGWTDSRYQVFLLTRAGHPTHTTLPAPIPNRATGRGSAYVQGHRYTSVHSLQVSNTTEDLR